MLDNCKKSLVFLCVGICISTSVISWKLKDPNESWQWIQRLLLQSYNLHHTSELKKWDLEVTPEGFFRLRKYFPSGKQEYFSFHFRQLKEVEYSGSSDSGSIVFRTFSDDVIVQTYNDPKGNIDSMSTLFELPVLHLQSQSLDSLRTAVSVFKH